MSRSVADRCHNLERWRQVTLPSHFARKLKNDKSDAQASSCVEAWQIFSFVSLSLAYFLIANLLLVLGFADDSCAQITCGEYCRSYTHIMTGFSLWRIPLQARIGRKKWHPTGSEVRSSSRVLTSLHTRRSGLWAWSNKTVECFHCFYFDGPYEWSRK